MLEQADRARDCGWAKVHVPLRRADFLMASELLDRPNRRTPHRQVRTERVPQYVNADLTEARTSGRPSHETLDFPLR